MSKNDGKIELPKSKEQVRKKNKKELTIKTVFYVLICCVIPMIYIGYDIFLITIGQNNRAVLFDDMTTLVINSLIYFCAIVINSTLFKYNLKVILYLASMIEFGLVIYYVYTTKANFQDALSIFKVIMFSTPFITGMIQNGSMKHKESSK